MKILLGMSKTGKSKNIYDNLKKDIKEGKNCFLFVPSQKREITEIEYMDELGIDGVIGVNITTISNYISMLCKKQNIHFDENYISKLDKKVLLKKIVNENQGIFKVFKKVSKKQGFIDLLNMYMDIFRKNDIDTKKLELLSIKNGVLLENKIKEIGKIYDIYNSYLSSNFVDNVDEMDIILKNKEKLNEEFKNSCVYIDGYNNFTNIEYKFIELLLSLNIDICISLVTDITCIEDIYTENSCEIFEESNKTYLKLLKIANKYDIEVQNKYFLTNYFKSSNKLKHLSQNIFKTNLVEYISNSTDEESLYLTIHQNLYKEVESVATSIKKEIVDGKRYLDFAIYTTDLDNYSNVISEIFYEYDIPFYVDTKKSISSSKLNIYICSLINLVKGYNVPNVLDILKLGLNDFLDEDISYLENYILEFDIARYGLKKPFYLNNDTYGKTVYDLERLNCLREKINEIFLEFIKKVEEIKTVKEYVSYIYEHLVKNKIFKNYEKFLLSIDDKKYQIYSSSIEAQVWDKVCEVFDSISKIYGRTCIKITEFGEIFSNVIQEVYVKTIPPTKDSVILADINVSKVLPKKIAFFVGVSENSFPKIPSQDILFNDFEIEKLKNYELEFKETTLSKENMAKYNIYEAMSNVSDKLYISMPSTDILGASTRKSSIITKISKITGNILIGDIADAKYEKLTVDSVYSLSKAFEFMIKRIDEILENIDITKKNEKNEVYLNKAYEIIAIYDYLKKDKRYSEIFEYLKSDKNLNEDIAKSIYKDEFNSSVSRLEMFKRCPFSYFVKYVLNVSKRNIFEITSLDTGTFMHDVIEKFSLYLFDNSYVWHEIIQDENTLKDNFKEVLNNIIIKELDSNFKKQKESVKYEVYKRKLTLTLEKVVIVIARSFNQSEFVPYGYEIEFNKNSKFLPIEIKLDNGNTMKIIGKIDRVDVLNTEHELYVRVIDYKSSKKSLSLDDVKDGISLQLMTYLSAFIQNIKENDENQSKRVLPAGCMYFNLSRNLVNLKDYTNDENVIKKEIIQNLRLRGIFLSDIKILEKMDKKINDTKEKMLDISPSTLGKNKKSLNEEEFVNLCSDIKNILKDIGDDMVRGVVSISKNKRAKHCEYCEYGSICRKNSCV